ncbi:interferon alpha-inducible protein 27, mitochondrial-like isoform X4 [Mirounga angustirostris]|uniref:interferon alpha-inducible protein 27, mitochondrial-like isoform X4 n=1 Tax=Mirounga angustirostris TaxID=9716 RepID=UPI00313D7FA9
MLVTFCTMEFFPVATSVSSLASKVMGSKVMSVSLAKATEVVSVAALSQATTSLGSLLGTLKASCLLGSPVVNLTVFKVGALSTAAVPAMLNAVGFTGAGIAASSLAAKMMSVAAVANGGGVAAGSLVATLQSVGAAGLSLSSKIILGSTGTVLVSRMVGL